MHYTLSTSVQLKLRIVKKTTQITEVMYRTDYCHTQYSLHTHCFHVIFEHWCQ